LAGLALRGLQFSRSSSSAWPAYHYGEAAYDRVETMTDAEGDKWLDGHARRAERLTYIFYAVAELPAVAINVGSVLEILT
jgi:hypothetical protein